MNSEIKNSKKCLEKNVPNFLIDIFCWIAKKKKSITKKLIFKKFEFLDVIK